MAARTRTRHAEIHAALARGLSITEISRALRLDRKTVRRYYYCRHPRPVFSPDTRVSLPACSIRTRPTCGTGRSRCAQH